MRIDSSGQIEAEPNGDGTFNIKVKRSNKEYEIPKAKIIIDNMCPKCNRVFWPETPNYCPDCGAKATGRVIGK